MTRLLTAAVLAPLLWLAIKKAPAWLFVALAVTVILAASWECYRMLGERGGRPFVWLGLGGTAAILLAYLDRLPLFEPAHAVVGTVLLATLAAMWRRADAETMLEAVLDTMFPMVFVGLTMGYLIVLRQIPAVDGWDLGSDLVLLLFICVIFGDTTAYYVGRAFGRRKLAPIISPNKTWAGAGGALAGGVLGALVAHLWFYQRLPLGHAVVLGVVLGVAGVLGDLAESLVKRACRVKDSSSVLPGHGGWFDRTDNLLFAAPVLYYYYVLLLRGTG